MANATGAIAVINVPVSGRIFTVSDSVSAKIFEVANTDPADGNIWIDIHTGDIPTITTNMVAAIATSGLAMSLMRPGADTVNLENSLNIGDVGNIPITTNCAELSINGMSNGSPTLPLPPLPSSPTILVDTGQTDDTLNAVLNYPFAFLRSYLGMSGIGFTQVNFTVKAASTDTDSQAIIAVQISDPPEDSDGMTRLNGAPTASSSDAALTVSTANVYGTTATTVGLQVNSRGMGITALGSYFWEISLYVDSTKQPVVDGGEFQAGPSIRSASGQS